LMPSASSAAAGRWSGTLLKVGARLVIHKDDLGRKLHPGTGGGDHHFHRHLDLLVTMTSFRTSTCWVTTTVSLTTCGAVGRHDQAQGSPGAPPQTANLLRVTISCPPFTTCTFELPLWMRRASAPHQSI
jgi:hypothetical protein